MHTGGEGTAAGCDSTDSATVITGTGSGQSGTPRPDGTEKQRATTNMNNAAAAASTTTNNTQAHPQNQQVTFLDSSNL